MANIIRQEDLHQNLTRLQGEMNQLTSRVLRPSSRRRSRIFPSIIISTTDEDLLVRAEVPGMKLDDFDLIELSEAFAVQPCAVMKELGMDPEKVNVHGGAVALGHPIGCSGARILVTLIYALKQTKGKKGLATLCLGGGNAVALSIEML